jgi:hypothetical protein
MSHCHRGNRIRSVGGSGGCPIEDQDHVQVIDATEQWIMPGLIDGHCHLSFGFPQMANIPSARGTTNPGFNALRAARNAQQVLRSGVTSLAVPGGTWFIDVALRDAITAGLCEGPRIACAGQFITYGSIIDNELSCGDIRTSIGVLANNVDDDHRGAAAVPWSGFYQIGRQHVGRYANHCPRRMPQSCEAHRRQVGDHSFTRRWLDAGRRGGDGLDYAR